MIRVTIWLHIQEYQAYCLLRLYTPLRFSIFQPHHFETINHFKLNQTNWNKVSPLPLLWWAFLELEISLNISPQFWQVCSGPGPFAWANIRYWLFRGTGPDDAHRERKIQCLSQLQAHLCLHWRWPGKKGFLVTFHHSDKLNFWISIGARKE